MTYPTYAEDVIEREFPALAVVSVWFGVMIVGITAVGYSISSPFGPPQTEPLVEMLQFVLVALILASVFYVFFRAGDGVKVTAVPLLINIGTLVILRLVPFGLLWEEARFQWHWQSYQAVVEQVEADTWQPDINGTITLPSNYAHLSADNGRIWVHTEVGTMAIFFVMEQRGENQFAGYLYRSDGRPPQPGDFLGQWRYIIQKQPNWFFCVSG
jgi:hypothetical protein